MAWICHCHGLYSYKFAAHNSRRLRGLLPKATTARAETCEHKNDHNVAGFFAFVRCFHLRDDAVRL